jgi:4-hydroxy-3-methylbut-2-en-1-yl diphosphate reductase
MLRPGSNYHRKGFGLKDVIKEELSREYESDLITFIRQNNNEITRHEVTIRLAQAFGFCWGVDRAVSMAYETRKQFPDRLIWITNEIIHNPVVNENLQAMDIKFVPRDADGRKDFSPVKSGDVVILPAFGASVQELDYLTTLSCEIVDTTCPWVSRVWSRVDNYKKSDFTAIIHGKYRHEETVATSSRAQHYLIVQDLPEATWVSNYILTGGSTENFLQKFKDAVSRDFNPEVHLSRLGVANQTTMLKGETELIGKLFEKTMLEKYGAIKLKEHFLSPGDTICDATQERQDAMQKLIEQGFDLVVVIGGYNSSNTGHLHDMAGRTGKPAYHIDGPDCIGADNSIKHMHSDGLETTTAPFLQQGQLTIGLSAGASTPDQVIAAVIERIFSLRETPQ